MAKGRKGRHAVKKGQTRPHHRGYIEAGMVLTGTEIACSRCSYHLKDGFAPD